MARINTTNSKTIKEKLEAQPKVSILIPSNPGVAPEVDYRIVRINGYGFKIMAGESVEVPQSVAEVLMNSDKTIAQINKRYADMTIGGGRNLNSGNVEE